MALGLSVYAGVAAVSVFMQPLEPEKMRVDVPVASWPHRKLASVSYHTHPVPFHSPTSTHEAMSTRFYENENSCAKRTFHTAFSRR